MQRRTRGAAGRASRPAHAPLSGPASRRPAWKPSRSSAPLRRRERPARRAVQQVALITGGDSGIGARCVLCAREGAEIAIVYMKAEQRDADDGRSGRRGRPQDRLLGRRTSSRVCRSAVENRGAFGHLDILGTTLLNRSIETRSARYDPAETHIRNESYTATLHGPAAMAPE